MKKGIYALLFIFTPLSTQAQPPVFDEAMTQKMQQVQQCMQSVDQTELARLEQRARQFEAEVKSLCRDGKRAEAQSRALQFSSKMEADVQLKQIRKCSQILKNAMPAMPFSNLKEKQATQHVCDY